MTGLRTIGAMLALAAIFVAAPALACTPSPNQDQFDKAYFRSVTSVYRVVAQEFTPTDSRAPSDDFSVRMKPVEAIWGQSPPQPFTLSFKPGMCNDWGLEAIEQGQTLNGRAYFVFFAPSARDRLSELHIIPAGDQSAAEALVTLGRLQESGSWVPRPDDSALPKWPPQAEVPSSLAALAGLARFRWPAVVGSAILLFLIGFGFGRASRSGRAKSVQ